MAPGRPPSSDAAGRRIDNRDHHRRRARPASAAFFRATLTRRARPPAGSSAPRDGSSHRPINPARHPGAQCRGRSAVWGKIYCKQSGYAPKFHILAIPAGTHRASPPLSAGSPGSRGRPSRRAAHGRGTPPPNAGAGHPCGEKTVASKAVTPKNSTFRRFPPGPPAAAHPPHPSKLHGVSRRIAKVPCDPGAEPGGSISRVGKFLLQAKRLRAKIPHFASFPGGAPASRPRRHRSSPAR